jgi:beta-glucosidase
VYPGGEFELHLKPFEDALAAGTRQMMPYYGMPVGTEYEEVGFGFNKSVITGLLRERYGFDGLVCTDWGLINDAEIFGQPFPARAWGVEDLTPRERMKKVLDAGADQFGGEDCPELLLELIADGEVTEERLDVSARRLLREKFELGLFENAFVDEDAADEIVGRADFRAAGEQAQRASVTLLTNAGALPFARGLKLYVEGVDADVAAGYGEVVETPAEADLAIIRLQAPFEVRETMFENFFHAGSLDFAAEVVDHVRAVAAAVPTVVDVLADRPPILTPITDAAAAVTVNWGASAAALLDVLSGAAAASAAIASPTVGTVGASAAIRRSARGPAADAPANCRNARRE